MFPSYSRIDLYKWFKQLLSAQEFINGNWIATEESLKSNIWIPCGQSLKLSDIINNGFTDLIEITEGNTFIQRYDVLRTTPRSSDSWQKNSNVLSFICESYSNLDGRYDKHRYESNSKYSTFETYGKYNDVYSQSNNYFKYQSLDLVGDSLIMFFSESQKWGILNYKNEIIVEPLFTSPNIFKNGKTILQQADGENYTVYINGKVEKQ